MKQIKNLDELREVFEKCGYYATDEILTEAFLGLSSFGGKVSPGQDVRALCLDGPPGSGKTSFVETYVKVFKELSKEEVEFIDYECNDTTGKSDLYEEINISSAIKRDADKVLIEGCITEAIRKVNEGKKVILFIDEFDKSRTETDVFFFKFLQSGKINTTQYGDLGILDEFKTNLQVFFCKNDLRELSAPLMRRTRSLKLDYMTPERFYQIATEKFLISNKADLLESLINLVALMYEFAYKNRTKFETVPSCSEMMIAINDAYLISTMINASSSDVHNLILKRMFKNEDDLQSFMGLISSSKKEEDKEVKKLLNDMKEGKVEVQTSLREIMLNEIVKTDEKLQELRTKSTQLLEFYDKKFKEKEKSLDEALKKVQNGEQSQINLEDGKLVTSFTGGSLSSLFTEEERIKRGKDIFTAFDSKDDFTKMASVRYKALNLNNLMNELIEAKETLNLIIYENGVLLKNNDIKLVFTVNYDTNGYAIFDYYVNNIFAPSNYLNILVTFSDFVKLVCAVDTPTVSMNSLFYNNKDLNGFEKVDEHIYNLDKENISLEELDNIVKNVSIDSNNISKVKEISSKLVLTK